MSYGFLGMDIDWVEVQAKRLQSLAEVAKQMAKRTRQVRDGAVNPKNWSGPVRDTFVKWFDGGGGAALDQVSQILAELAENFAKNARGQRQVSNYPR